MPDYQNPKAKTLHLEAIALYDQAERAQTQAEHDDLWGRAEAKQREADKIENATR